MRNADTTEELHAFETGALDPAKFPHAEHLRLGYEMLARHPFGEAVMRFSRGLQLAAKAGRPQVYHETITVAFLAVINDAPRPRRPAKLVRVQENQCRPLRQTLPGKNGIKRFKSSSLPIWRGKRFACLRLLRAPRDRPAVSLAWRDRRPKGAVPRSRVAPG